MMRYLMVAVALVVFGTAAWAGGPPPVYVVVDKVTLEPSESPNRIRIEGCFVRLEKGERSGYGKPVEGYVDLSIQPGKEAECRAEWAKWQKAAGTGKAVAVGSCGDGGALLSVKIRKSGETSDKPDAVYQVGKLERWGGLYADGDLARQSPVTDLLAFAKAREKGQDAGRR